MIHAIFPWWLMIASGGAVAAFVLWLWPEMLTITDEAGEIGKRRQEALVKHAWFNALAPIIGALADKFATLQLSRLRQNFETRLKKAGYPLGLNVNELFALSVLTGVASAALGALLCHQLDRSLGVGLVIGAVFGLYAPLIKTDSAARDRLLSISHSLPQAIDLVALAMEAGLDFHGGLSQVASRMQQTNPLRFEFEHIINKLTVGWSRQRALIEFSTRIPIKSVTQFVSAVNQAEKRGTPLARVLSAQAEVIRLRRSQAAERAAARAAVLILGPLMLIFAAIILLILGPFIIKMIRGELF